MTPVPADSLRAVLHRVFADPAYHWVTPRAPLAFLSRWFDAVTRWFDRVSANHPEAGYAILAGLVVILVAVLVHGAFVVAGTVRRAAALERSGPAVRIAERRDAAWHRRQADRLAREGRYAEALMAEFWAVIAELDSRRLVKFHPSKTPGEYISEPGLGPSDRSRLAALVERLYALVFAGREIHPDDLHAWRQSALDRWGQSAV